MKNTKLIELLKTFSKEEMKEFEKFVASPYFSRGRDLLPFYKILKSFYPGFDNTNFTYENVYKKLNPKLKYSKANSDNTMRVMSSDLVKLAEEYLIYENFKLDSLRWRISLIEAFHRKNLNKLFYKLLCDTQNNISKFVDHGYTSRYFCDMYFLNMFEVIYNIFNNKRYKNPIEPQIALLNFFFLCAGNSINNTAKNKSMYNIDAGDNLVEKFMRCFDFKSFILHLNKSKEINKSDKEILELCFYSLAHNLDIKNESYIAKIETLFYKNKHLFRIDNKLVFYFLLQSAFERNNEKKKLYALYKHILKDEIYSATKGMKMSFILYFNILHNFAEKNLSEAERFVLKYTECLNTDNKETFFNYSYSFIEFKKKNFEKALEHISKIELISFYFKYHARLLYLLIYYELNYNEPAISMIDSFKHFLRKNQNVPDKLGMNYKKFADYYSRLLKIKMSGYKSGKKILQKNISDEEYLFHKDWLLDKIDEL